METAPAATASERPPNHRPWGWHEARLRPILLAPALISATAARTDEVPGVMSKRVRTCALLAGALLLAAARGAVALDRVTCVTIRTDETVASVAQRVTGDARNMQAPWFQIVNPITARPVPKARYGFVFAGWNACTTTSEPPPAIAIEPAAPVLSTVSLAAAPPARTVDPGV